MCCSTHTSGYKEDLASLSYIFSKLPVAKDAKQRTFSITYRLQPHCFQCDTFVSCTESKTTAQRNPPNTVKWTKKTTSQYLVQEQ